MNNAIEVEGVSKSFKDRSDGMSLRGIVTGFNNTDKNDDSQDVLKKVGFSIKKGEFFGIVGRNGSGKSTLLKIIAGIYQADSGVVRIEGSLVPFIELGVGFNPELTGKENVYLNGAMLGFSNREMDDLYEGIVGFAELKGQMDKQLKNYSSGMQVRLAFSIAIRSKAEILLIDEVLAVGDSAFQRKCLDYFKELKSTKRTVIFVSHNMDAVREYCDRAVLIDGGEIIKSGKPGKVAVEYLRKLNSDSSKKETTKAKQKSRVLKISKQDVKASESLITVSFELEAKIDAKDIVLGFLIKDKSGKYLVGTNTKINGDMITDMKKGTRRRIVWSIDNALSTGSYHLELAALYDNTSVGTWLTSAKSFTIQRLITTPYPMQVNMKTRVKEA